MVTSSNKLGSALTSANVALILSTNKTKLSNGQTSYVVITTRNTKIILIKLFIYKLRTIKLRFISK